MSATVETMMYVREKPWHGLGTMVQEAPTSEEALRLAGLDWTVEQHPIFADGAEIPSYKANIRSSDSSCLGVVGNRYRVVQNAEAFKLHRFPDWRRRPLRNRWKLCGGKKIWLLAKMPDTEICGDKTEPYMVFTNSHDGTGTIRVCMTPIRVVCNNTLNLALNSAQRAWSVHHVGDISAKLSEAWHCLEMANGYMNDLAEQADRLANKIITDDRLREILNDLFPENDDMSDVQKRHVQRLKDEYMVCWFAPDIAKFRNTAWGAVNAMSDMVTHTKPHRNTASYQANNWNRVMSGHYLIDQMAAAVGKGV